MLQMKKLRLIYSIWSIFKELLGGGTETKIISILNKTLKITKIVQISLKYESSVTKDNFFSLPKQNVG